MGIKNKFFARAYRLLTRIEQLLPAQNLQPDWNDGYVFRWVREGYHHGFVPLRRVADVRLEDLQCIDRQMDLLVTNTRQHLRNLPCNNALLWGPRGTGKSSLIMAVLNEFHSHGLRLIQVDRHLLADLPLIMDVIENRTERFILFCDDLSFADNDDSYKDLKVLLDGSGQRLADNTVVYATSNRRHLLAEHMTENLEVRVDRGELHYGDTTEEKLSLSERFGLRIAFHPFNQEQYLSIVDYWLRQLTGQGDGSGELRRAALEWALENGTRSGRSAWQFARAWAGRQRLDEVQEDGRRFL